MEKVQTISKGYSIRQVEEITGIKAHTLRVWEQRYAFLTPSRSTTNIRHYSLKDLNKILHLGFLTKNGYRISYLSTLSEDEILQRVHEISRGFAEAEGIIEALFMATMDLDSKRLNQLLNEGINQSGLDNMIRYVIYPLLRKIGHYWENGILNPAMEHFLSHIIRNKLVVELENIPEGRKEPLVVAFLPEWEQHDLHLLFTTYILKRKGYSIIYLGQSSPEILTGALTGNKAIALLTVLTIKSPVSLREYLFNIVKDYEKLRVLVSGNDVRGSEIPSGTILFNDPEEIPEL